MDKNAAAWTKPHLWSVRSTWECYLVTGASSGIGLAVVRILAAKGCRVTASGRRPSRELPVDFPDVDYVTLDATDRTGVAELMSRLAPCLDRAVLCAGAGFYRFVEAETSAEIKRMVDVNLSSQIRLAHRLYIPLARNGGRLCFIGSVAYKGSAAMPVYAATKAALDGLGRSLALEWQGRIVVKVLHLGLRQPVWRKGRGENEIGSPVSCYRHRRWQR